MEFRKTYSLDDILIVPRYSDLTTRKNCDISLGNYKLPIMMSAMDTLSNPKMIEMIYNHGGAPTIHRYFKSASEQLDVIKKISSHKELLLHTWFAVGSVQKYKDWIKELFDNGVTNFIVDMAHGDSKSCVETVEYIDGLNWTGINIIAGNVVTKAGFERLQKAGAVGIRVGIGSGSICSTRINCGIGIPQFTAIMDCAERKDHNTILIADGGIKNTGDMVKAIAAGADLCMCGKLLASTNLANGLSYDKNKEIISDFDLDNICYKGYRGMASKEARQSILEYASVEGVSGLVKYTGTTEQLLIDIKLRLQSAQSYLGVTNWNDFRKYAKFQIITDSSYKESSTNSIIQ